VILNLPLHRLIKVVLITALNAVLVRFGPLWFDFEAGSRQIVPVELTELKRYAELIRPSSLYRSYISLSVPPVDPRQTGASSQPSNVNAFTISLL
jgi:hypothetical protein